MEFQPIVSPLFVCMCGIAIIVGFVFLAIRIQRADFLPNRKITKQLLHGLLCLGLLAFILNPVWISEPSSRPVLIYSSDLDKSEIDFWKDSLKIEKAIATTDFKGNGDSLILLGKDFSKEFIYALRSKSLDWIIPAANNTPSFLNWKGVLALGEVQAIQLGLDLKSGAKVTVRQAGNELENYTLDSDRTEFRIEKSVSILGRNEWEIWLDADSIGSIRFFVMPNPVLRFQLQVGFPGPEIRTLSRFLIGKGEQVQEAIQLSKNTELLTERQPLDSVDVFVIDPSQLQNPQIRQQMDRGVSILLVNLSEPEKEIDALNKAFGVDFQVYGRGAETRILENKLEALPFEIKSKSTQETLFENSVAIQRIGNSKVGVSLLTGTFGLAQAGDSLGYQKIWDQILAELRPATASNLQLDAPLFQDQFYNLYSNGTDSVLNSQLESKNLSQSQSLINSNSTLWEGYAQDTGWQKLTGNAEIYYYQPSDWPMVFAQQERGRFLQSQSWLSSASENRATKKPISFWLWGLVLMGILTALWLEPKVFK